MCVACVEQHVKQKSNFGFGIWMRKRMRDEKKIQTTFYGQICFQTAKFRIEIGMRHAQTIYKKREKWNEKQLYNN